MESNNINSLFCNKTFTQKKSLYVHCWKFHDTDIKPVKTFKCEDYDVTCLTQRILTVHVTNFKKPTENSKY